MLSTIEGLKDDLAKLAGVLNQFRSEAVQIKLFDRLLGLAAPASAPATIAVTEVKPRRGRPPKAARQVIQPNTLPARGKKTRRGNMGETGALNALIAKGYFKSRRNIAEIVLACESKAGVSVKVTNLSGPLGRFVDEGKLQRAKNSQSKFEYWAK